MNKFDHLSRDELVMVLTSIDANLISVPENVIREAQWRAATTAYMALIVKSDKAFNAWSAASKAMGGKFSLKRAAARDAAYTNYIRAKSAADRAYAKEQRAWKGLDDFWSAEIKQRGAA